MSLNLQEKRNLMRKSSQKQEVVISVNSSKAITVSNYNKIANLVNKHAAINNNFQKSKLPTIQKHEDFKDDRGSFTLEQGQIK